VLIGFAALSWAGCSSSSSNDAFLLPDSSFADGGAPIDAGAIADAAAVDAGMMNSAVQHLMNALAAQEGVNQSLTSPGIQFDVTAIRMRLATTSTAIAVVASELMIASDMLKTGTSSTASLFVNAAINEVTFQQSLTTLLNESAANTSTRTYLAHFQELQAHGSVTFSDTNIALSKLDAGPSAPASGRILMASDVAASPGYRVQIIANQLNFATAVAIGGDGTVYVAEAGYSYGGITAPARILSFAPQAVQMGTLQTPNVLIAGRFNPPIAGMAIRGNTLFVSHRGTISAVDLRTMNVTDIITDLPAGGDHPNEGITIGPDQRLYLTIGTVTNSGVVGVDNYVFGWLPKTPMLRDHSCRRLTLAGDNFLAGNILTAPVGDLAITGVYLPFGGVSVRGQMTHAEIKCNGAVLSSELDGTDLHVFADGFRNPFGIAFNANGDLFVTENGPDFRGSRPLNAPDNFYRVLRGGWYGFPDFFSGIPVSMYFNARIGPLPPVLLDPPQLAGQPIVRFAQHASANGFDFARDDVFAPRGTAFVAEFGDLTPFTAGGIQLEAGHRVVEVSEEGVITSFLAATTVIGGNAMRAASALFRPTDARFDTNTTRERALYVIHFGQVEGVAGGVIPVLGTGALLRITKTATTTMP
jgi:glucose/arabinose dehydrogenase